MQPNDFPLIFAPSSPARRALVARLALPFGLIPGGLDETPGAIDSRPGTIDRAKAWLARTSGDTVSILTVLAAGIISGRKRRWRVVNQPSIMTHPTVAYGTLTRAPAPVLIGDAP